MNVFFVVIVGGGVDEQLFGRFATSEQADDFINGASDEAPEPYDFHLSLSDIKRGARIVAVNEVRS